MASEDSVTQWILELKVGKGEQAAEALWNRYFERLVDLARQKLRGKPRRIADEEDVALSAFASFCAAAKRGRFPDLSDRDSLWRLLFEMTTRKAVDLIRYNTREKRKGRGESALLSAKDDSEIRGFALISGNEPTPEFAAMAGDELQRLLGALDDPELEALCVAKMEGYENTEIAKQFDCSLRTVERRLQLIRRIWEESSMP